MIYVECKPDHALVVALTHVPKKSIVHDFKGKFEVCKRLEKSNNSKGLIDEDPASVQPLYLKNTSEEDKFLEHDLKVRRDAESSNDLIILSPRLEEWILKTAKESGIDVRKYDLPNEAAKLHSEINLSLDKFERLLKDMEGSNRLKALKRLLERK